MNPVQASQSIVFGLTPPTVKRTGPTLVSIVPTIASASGRTSPGTLNSAVVSARGRNLREREHRDHEENDREHERDGDTAGKRWRKHGVHPARSIYPTPRMPSMTMSAPASLSRRLKRDTCASRALATLMPPDDYARLLRLRDRGILEPGFERIHPLHLARRLREAVKGGIVYGPDPDTEIRERAAARKLKVILLESRSMKLLVEDLFSTTPEVHVACLEDAIALIEEGPAAIEERSRAWIEQRIPAVIGSRAQRVLNRC